MLDFFYKKGTLKLSNFRKTDGMELHEIIRQHRLEKGITQEQLAERLFITRQSISRWETGKVNPPLNALYDLADFYNLSLDEFLGGKKIMKKTKLNLLSLIGSLIFNALLLSTFGLFMVGLLIAAWGSLVIFILAPIMFILFHILKFQGWAWDQFIYSLLMGGIGLLVLKPLIHITKTLWKICVKYFRYNMSNIYYEIEE